MSKLYVVYMTFTNSLGLLLFLKFNENVVSKESYGKMCLLRLTGEDEGGGAIDWKLLFRLVCYWIYIINKVNGVGLLMTLVLQLHFCRAANSWQNEEHKCFGLI